MGMMKEYLWTYYEAIGQEFEEKYGRSPTTEEASKFWDEARERADAALMARAKELREQ
jgi:hypothetical protein